MNENGCKEALGLSQQEIADFEKHLANVEKRARQDRTWIALGLAIGESVLALAVGVACFFVSHTLHSVLEDYPNTSAALSSTAPATLRNVSDETAQANTHMLFTTLYYLFRGLAFVCLWVAVIMALMGMRARSKAKQNLLFVKIARRLWEGNQAREMTPPGQEP